MKIGAVTITYNDDYKFEEWFEHYNEYREELFLHVIVDNGSKQDYLNKVKKLFDSSVIIERKTNGGCTIAYNDGIKYLLEKSQVDSIILIGNDIKLEKGTITKLYNLLQSNSKIGMVAPILLEKDSNIVADFGCTISNKMSMKPYCEGLDISTIKEAFHYSQALTGGINMAPRKFYKEVGLQDEKLFMYADEIDMGLRAKKSGYQMIATKEAISWHQHINQANAKHRHPYSRYLSARNKVYLTRKHFGLGRFLYIALYTQLFGIAFSFRGLLRRDKVEIQYGLWIFWGAINGLFNNMKLNRFTHPDAN